MPSLGDNALPLARRARSAATTVVRFPLALAVSLTELKLHPAAHPVFWSPIFASIAYGFVLSTMADSYLGILQRGENKTWEAVKRLATVVLLNYAIYALKSGGDWHVLIAAKTTFSVWVLGLAGRYLAAVLNQIPKIQEKYYLKPLLFPVRFPTPFRRLAARLLGDRSKMRSQTKGVTMIREISANLCFVLTFPCLIMDTWLSQHGYWPASGLLLAPIAWAWDTAVNRPILSRMRAKYPQIAPDA